MIPDPPKTLQEWASIAAGYYQRLPIVEQKVEETMRAALGACSLATEARDLATQARDASERVERLMNGAGGYRDRQPSAHDVDMAIERLDHRLEDLEENTSPGMLTRAELEARLAAKERESMRVKIEVLEKEKAAGEAKLLEEQREKRKRVWFVVLGIVLFVAERGLEWLAKGHF